MCVLRNFISLLLVGLLFFAVSIAVAQMSPQRPCAESVPICPIVTTPINGLIDIGTTVGFRIPYLPEDDFDRTDIGVVVGYFWDDTTKQYMYSVLQNPADYESNTPRTRARNVYREDILNGFD